MRVVWKFGLPVTDGVEILMPEGAEILHVANQYEVNISTLEVWALVDPDADEVPRKFTIHGTGHPVTDGGTYVGTVISAQGRLVWHVFDHGEKNVPGRISSV